MSAEPPGASTALPDTSPSSAPWGRLGPAMPDDDLARALARHLRDTRSAWRLGDLLPLAQAGRAPVAVRRALAERLGHLAAEGARAGADLGLDTAARLLREQLEAAVRVLLTPGPELEDADTHVHFARAIGGTPALGRLVSKVLSAPARDADSALSSGGLAMLQAAAGDAYLVASRQLLVPAAPQTQVPAATVAVSLHLAQLLVSPDRLTSATDLLTRCVTELGREYADDTVAARAIALIRCAGWPSGLDALEAQAARLTDPESLLYDYTAVRALDALADVRPDTARRHLDRALPVVTGNARMAAQTGAHLLGLRLRLAADEPAEAQRAVLQRLIGLNRLADFLTPPRPEHRLDMRLVTLPAAWRLAATRPLVLDILRRGPSFIPALAARLDRASLHAVVLALSAPQDAATLLAVLQAVLRARTPRPDVETLQTLLVHPGREVRQVGLQLASLLSHPGVAPPDLAAGRRPGL